tara:strand:+ start:1980 stop:2780 length:801 start_codon:yes stop_codon:yes gene_type:complete
MENVSFLGGSGYIGSLIKKYDFSIKKDIEFYSRRKTENCIQYTDLDELPNCEILFDLSQWANGKDIEKLGIDKMKELIKKSISKAERYIFISTLSIDINKKLNYPFDKYCNAKLNFEKMLLEYDNTYILRIPTCFYKNPKKGTLIRLLFDRLNGSKETIKQPMKYTSGITIIELINFFKILIKSNNRFSEIYGNSRILRLGDGYAYRISKLEEFLRIQLSKESLIYEKFNYPEGHKVNLIDNNNWHLQSVCFPIRMLQTFKSSLKS